MSEGNDTKEQSGFEQVPEVPVPVLNTYSRLWQLETWLRNMVYVELRALLGDDWAKGLNPSSNSFQADKSLTHMPTPEMNGSLACIRDRLVQSAHLSRPIDAVLLLRGLRRLVRCRAWEKGFKRIHE